MPMGLSNSAATFRLMNLVLAGLTYKSCLVYLDDIIIFAPTLEIHLERMKAVFDRIHGAKLELRPDKCYLLQREIKFLGHMFSEKGVAMDPGKLDCVASWPAPKKLKDVRAFRTLFILQTSYQGLQSDCTATTCANEEKFSVPLVGGVRHCFSDPQGEVDDRSYHGSAER